MVRRSSLSLVRNGVIVVPGPGWDYMADGIESYGDCLDVLEEFSLLFAKLLVPNSIF